MLIVDSRPERFLLALHELGPVYRVVEKDGADRGQPRLHWRRLCYRTSPFHLPVPKLKLTAILQCGLGLYTSGKSIHDNPASSSFSCANNA